MLKLLDEKEREVLRPVFDKAFDSELPPADQANILAVIEDGKIIAFLTSEVLIRVGLLWVHPKIRKTTKSAKAVRQLAIETRKAIPQGASVITIGTEFSRIFEKLGMRKVEGDVYRIDL